MLYNAICSLAINVLHMTKNQLPTNIKSFFREQINYIFIKNILFKIKLYFDCHFKYVLYSVQIERKLSV